MQRTFNDVLLDLLTIIKYTKHKRQNFVKEFEELNHAEAMVNMLDRLPGISKAKIKLHGVTPEILDQYIDRERYTAEIVAVSAKALANFIDVVSPLLTLDQKEKISLLMRKEFHLQQ